MRKACLLRFCSIFMSAVVVFNGLAHAQDVKRASKPAAKTTFLGPKVEPLSSPWTVHSGEMPPPFKAKHAKSSAPKIKPVARKMTQKTSDKSLELPDMQERGYVAPVPAEPPPGEFVENPVSAEASFMKVRDWHARSGQSMREVLGLWSGLAGVKLLWEDKNEFSVLQDLTLNGDYKTAVQALLAQYKGDGVRPVAEDMMQDDAGKMVLRVHVQRD